jgi:hypothetical protein
MIKLEFGLRVTKCCTLPQYLGNTIRGVLGNAMIERFCAAVAEEKAVCEVCPYNAQVPILSTKCIYASCFKSLYRSDRFTSVPNPFVINVPQIPDVHCCEKRIYAKGENIYFSIVLFGKAISYAQQIVSCMKQIPDMEFGGNRDCLELVRIPNPDKSTNTQEEDKMIASLAQVIRWEDHPISDDFPVEELEITFLTPVQILREHKPVCELTFPVLMDCLFARIAAMIDIYAGGVFQVPYGLLYRKPYIQVTKVGDTWKKKVIRQGAKEFSGYVGTLRLQGDLSDYLPYLQLGEWLHVGKLTTRGFGEYRLHR